jgi:hypothetical protein
MPCGFPEGLSLVAGLVTHSELMATLLATGGKHLAAVGVFHAGTEAVLVLSLALMRLKCPFHRLNSILLPKRDGKNNNKHVDNKPRHINFHEIPAEATFTATLRLSACKVNARRPHS